MNNKGRPKNEIPESLIKEIIYRYSKEKKVTGKIKYMDIFRFAVELFENKEILYKTSEFFWRKGDGRNLVDKANEIFIHSLSSSSNIDETVIDTEDAVNKFYSGSKNNKEKLIGLLRMNEQKLKFYIVQQNKYEKSLTASKEETRLLKEKVNELNKQITQYENKLFQWLDLSIGKSVPLLNLLTTGVTRTSTTQELLKSIFSDNPLEVFEHLKVTSNIQTSNNINIQDSAIDINKYKKKQNSILDDINF